MSIAFLIVGLILGLSLMAHGTQKLFGFEGLGYRHSIAAPAA